MRIIIIGAVAAGTSAAAKARRNSEDAEIVLYEKDGHISYSGCGMPYYIGGIVDRAETLTPRDPAFFKSKYNVDIKILHEVLSIHPEEKTLRIKNLVTGEIFSDTYDKLILATGAGSVPLPVKGADGANVFMLRTIGDMNRIKAFIDMQKPKSTVIIGSGFIGLEMCENLARLGLKVTLVEKLPQIDPALDADMAIYLEEHLKKNGITVRTSTVAAEIAGNEVLLSDGTKVDADLVIVSIGVRPETTMASKAGIELGITGAIKVDREMRTSHADILACGDCTEQFHLVTGKPVYRPLGSTANKTGRIAGDVVTGGDLEFRGILGTGIFKVFDMAVAQTGLTEQEAIADGFDIVVCHNIKPDRPEYIGGREMVIKAVADKATGRILGAQIIGFEGVDKRIDVLVTAITFKATAEDLIHLDLAYAPPFSTTKDPVMYTGMILDNAIRKGRPLMTAKELYSLITSEEKVQLIDTRAPAQYEKGHIDTAESIPLAILREEIHRLDKEAVTVTYCNKGITGNAAQNVLLHQGFKKVFNLSGGYNQFKEFISTKNH